MSLDGGTVRVGSFHSVAANWLPQIVRSFLQIYPNVDIQISYNLEYSAIENSIIQGGVDCGFVTLPLNVRSTPPLHTFFLKREQLCAVLPRIICWPGPSPTQSPAFPGSLYSHPSGIGIGI